MKIGPLENKALTSQAVDRKAKSGDASTATSVSPEPSTKVELSAAGNAIANGLSDGSFDAQKVERLGKAIREGTYQIDAQAIADKLLAHSRELLERGAQ